MLKGVVAPKRLLKYTTISMWVFVIQILTVFNLNKPKARRGQGEARIAFWHGPRIILKVEQARGQSYKD